MSRALYITHKEVFPVAGGDQVRMSQMLSMLADHHEVDLLSLTHSRTVPSQSEFEPRLCGETVMYVPRWKRYLRASRTLVNTLPEFVNHYADGRIADYVRDHGADYDVILCGSAAMARFAPAGHPGVRLDITDSLAMNYHNAALSHGGLRRAWLESESRRMLRYERECRNRFPKVAYISEVDRAYAACRPERSVIVGNYVDIPPTDQCCAHALAARDISFIGRMDYEPNIAAVSHFADLWQNGLDKVAPKFHIVGGFVTPRVSELGRINGISVDGFVPSLTPVFRDSALIVAPMLSGSGIQNKILQALAHGCCVVTTPIGAEGLDAESGAFVVALPGKSFADAVTELLAAPDDRRRIGQRAREYAVAHFSRLVIHRQFTAFIH